MPGGNKSSYVLKKKKDTIMTYAMQAMQAGKL